MIMSDSLLQKDFKERDIQRMRNLITKKYGDKTGIQTGYVKKQEIHKENDIWEENGKTWTIKNGIKTTVSKLDAAKKLFQVPLLCPNCNQPMKKKELDKKFYFIHKKCFDCVIKYESELKRLGKYEEYERNLIKNNAKSYISDLEQIATEILLSNNLENIFTEQGDMEQWHGGFDKEKIINELNNHINKIKDNLKE